MPSIQSAASAAAISVLCVCARAGGFDVQPPPPPAKPSQLPDPVRDLVVRRVTMYPEHELACRITPILPALPTRVDLGRKPIVYVTDKPVTFVVEGIDRDYNAASYYRVKLEDGTQGYVKIGLGGHSIGLSEKTVSKDPTEMFVEHSCYAVYTPSEREAIIAAKQEEAVHAAAAKAYQDAALEELRIKEEAAAAAWAKKPNARIGMTAKQVREATNWGPPEDVHKTIIAGRVSEQWVYPDGQYLYFENGRLTAIQD